MPAFERSARIAESMPGYWIFTATSRPSCSDAAVHLADRRGRERLRLDPLEQLLVGLVVLLLEHPAHLLPGHRGGRGAQRRQLLLVQLAVLLGQVVGVDERGELPHLHRGALHRAERVDQALGGRRARSRPSARAASPWSARRPWPWCRRTARPRPRARMPSIAERASRLLGIERSLRSSAIPDKLAVGPSRRHGCAARIRRSMAAGERTLLTLGPREERGSRANRRLRREGLVPGVIYGAGVGFHLVQGRLAPPARVLAEGHALFDVEIDGSERQPVIVKDQHRDPVRGQRAAPRPAEGAPRREDPVDGGRSRSRASRTRPACERAACSSTSRAS